MNGFRSAAAFLTRVPMGRTSGGPQSMAVAVPWFPVVGALVGATVAGVYAVSVMGLPRLPAAALAVGWGLLLTGAFHEDGLGDVADAMAGGWTVEERLRIMRDPRLGTFGVSAIGLSLLIRASAVASLEPWGALGALVAAHALGRAAAVLLITMFPPATDEGLGASYAEAATTRRVLLAAAAGLLIAASMLGIVVLLAAVVALAGAVGVGLLARRRVGGVTGDVLGAAEQTAEVLTLLLTTAVVTKGWATIPWWR